MFIIKTFNASLQQRCEAEGRAFRPHLETAKAHFLFTNYYVASFFPEVLVTDWFPRGLGYSTDKRAVSFLL